jgi:hypothetical protein
MAKTDVQAPVLCSERATSAQSAEDARVRFAEDARVRFAEDARVRFAEDARVRFAETHHAVLAFRTGGESLRTEGLQHL